jgi:glycosyltransferase involved in cell wall biosynthesis
LAFDQLLNEELATARGRRRKLRVCVNSQTPLVRFLLSDQELSRKYQGSLDLPIGLECLERGVDFEYTPGGVTAMLLPLLNRMREMDYIRDPTWFSLASPNSPEAVSFNHLNLRRIHLSKQEMMFYSYFKEAIWNEIHGLGKFEFAPEEYDAFLKYNWLSSQAMLEIVKETDLFFIHDFQQLMTGAMIGPAAPTVFQWHIPLRLDLVSPKLGQFILNSLQGFNALIVSTKRELEGLIQAGYRGRAYQVYPYVDPEAWMSPSSEELGRFREEMELENNDRVLLVVARMDPIKSQDVAIKAFSRVKKIRNNVKLVIIGGGGFSGSVQGGLGLTKHSIWRDNLQQFIRDLSLENGVILAGDQPAAMVRAAYSTADATLVPSRREGFNLTTIESWTYKKPVVVSSGAGSSELVVDDVNGYTFPVGDDQELADRILRLIDSPESAAKMGENGFYTGKACDIDRSISSIQAIFDETIARS